MALKTKLDINDPEVIPYLHKLDWNASVSLCTTELFISRDICQDCPFGTLNNCLLNYYKNKHLHLFVQQAKQQYPEYFI